MRVPYVFFCLVIVVKFGYSQEQNDADENVKDNPLYKIAKTYFRSNPFSVHFSTFLNHLTHDPTLLNTTLNKRTDTSLFFFGGEYKGHNPYGFKADRVEIRLAEKKVYMSDSASTADTLLFYQLVGYSYGANGMEAVKKEFSRFDHKFGRYYHSEDSALNKENEPIGMIRNYFFWNEIYLSPVAISWEKLDNLQNVFIIMFRIKLAQNMATLPECPDGD